jgi:hypothetical protein
MLSCGGEDTPYEFWLWTKVQEKANLDRSCFQEVEQLPLVSVNELPRRLRFDENSVLDQEIGSIYANSLSAVIELDRNFSLNLRPSLYSSSVASAFA